jgi:hypothetical protein
MASIRFVHVEAPVGVPPLHDTVFETKLVGMKFSQATVTTTSVPLLVGVKAFAVTVWTVPVALARSGLGTPLSLAIAMV